MAPAHVIVPAEEGHPVFLRLKRLGLRSLEGSSEPVPLLDASNAGQIWLVPEDLFLGPDWPRLRVDLHRAPRSFLVAFSSPETERVVEAMRDGAFDVLALGDSDERWQNAVESARRSQQLWVQLYAGRIEDSNPRLVGCSPAINTLRRELERIGPTDVSVLILGESGVGKERVAVALHETSRGGPLVTLNCAAMPRELVEAELFGAEKGAFTGAVRSRTGLVEQAHGGTLFLDEVGELDLSLQPKLLRFLETRRARRVGGETEYSVQVRVLAATNRNPETAVAAGQFRADLYYRLAEVVLTVPPLRERKEDIAPLVRSFLAQAAERFGKPFDSVEPGLLLRFQDYSWPGNVRELKSAVDRLVLFHDGPVLRAGWWDPPSAPARGRTPEVASEEPVPQPTALAGAKASRSARIELAERLLSEGRLSLSEVAARAGIHPTTLFRWRKTGKTRH